MKPTWVVIEGPDGVGKTALCREIENYLSDFIRMNYEHRKFPRDKNIKKSLNMEDLFLMEHILNKIEIEERLGGEDLIIQDRGELSYLVYGRIRGSIHSYREKVIYDLFLRDPQPTLVVVLEGDEETIFERALKGEKEPWFGKDDSYIERIQTEYRNVVSGLKQNPNCETEFVFLDSTMMLPRDMMWEVLERLGL